MRWTTALLAAVLWTSASLCSPANAGSQQQATLPDAAGLVRTAMERIGGERWKSIKSFESIASARTAMGEARVEFRFVAPSARQLVQTMPGGRGVMEMGVVDGVAWMGEPGAARTIDARIAEEMSGGGDLQTLVHSLPERFGEFTVVGKSTIGGREAWKVTMLPRSAPGMPGGDQRWTVFIDSTNTTVLGLDIPAPAKSTSSNPPEPNPPESSGQTIRLADWRQVDLPAGTNPADPSWQRMLAFRSATIESGGLKTELIFSRVAVDTLAKGAIAVPARIEPAPSN